MAEFDQFGSDYRQRLEKSIGVLGSVDSALLSKIQVLKRIARGGDDSGQQPVVDFGCGAGLLTRLLHETWPDAFGVDISLASMQQIEPKSGRFVQFDGHHLPLADQTVGLVVASCVFHHILPAERFVIIEEICRTLKTDGRLVVIEHNPLNPVTRYVVNRCEFDENAELMTLGATQRLLEKAGLEPDMHGYFYAVPPLRPGLSRIDHGLRRLPLGAQYYCAYRKPAGWQPSHAAEELA